LLPFAPLPSNRFILEAIYYLNGGNFQQVEYYLSLTWEEFQVMLEIHKSAIERQQKAMKSK
jgi:hypothetical protein